MVHMRNRKPGSCGRAGAGCPLGPAWCSGVSNAVSWGRSCIRDGEQVTVSSSSYNITKVTIKNKEVCLQKSRTEDRKANSQSEILMNV